MVPNFTRKKSSFFASPKKVGSMDGTQPPIFFGPFWTDHLLVVEAEVVTAKLWKILSPGIAAKSHVHNQDRPIMFLGFIQLEVEKEYIDIKWLVDIKWSEKNTSWNHLSFGYQMGLPSFTSKVLAMLS